MGERARVIVIISGRGSNLFSLLGAARHYEIIAVLSNRSAPGLEFAHQLKIPSAIFALSCYENRSEQQAALFGMVRELDPDIVVLAGFMAVVEQQYTEEFAGKLVNIHPSLLPKYPGLDTHERVLAAGEREHGCSVHFVDGGIDTGTLIAQASCTVSADDTSETLAQRVLELEHRLFPWVVNHLAQKSIVLEGSRIAYAPGLREEAAEEQFILFPVAEADA